MAQNTTYHQAIKRSPKAIFCGRVSYNAFNLKITNSIKTPPAKTDITTFIDHINEKYKINAENIFEAFHKYKRYYDRMPKLNHSKLVTTHFCWTLTTPRSTKPNLNIFIGWGHTRSPKLYRLPTTSFGKLVLPRHSALNECVQESSSHKSKLQMYKQTKNSTIPFPKRPKTLTSSTHMFRQHSMGQHKSLRNHTTSPH